MVMMKRMPRASDAVRVPHLMFRHIGIDFNRDDPRPEITADVEAFVDDMNELRELYDAGAIDIGHGSALVTEPPHYALRLDRSIDIEPPWSSSRPVLRGSGRVYARDREGGPIIILVRVPFQRRPWRITIELDHGRDWILPREPLTMRQAGLAEMIIQSARPLFRNRGGSTSK